MGLRAPWRAATRAVSTPLTARVCAQDRLLDEQPDTIFVEHSFGGAFSARGRIVPKSATSSSGIITQEFTAADADQLYALAKAGGDYVLRVAGAEIGDSAGLVQT